MVSSPRTTSPSMNRRDHAANRQLYRNVRAVDLPGHQLDTLCQRSAAGGLTFGHPLEIFLALREREQQLHLAAEHLQPAVAEHLFGGGIELADVQVLVH